MLTYITPQNVIQLLSTFTLVPYSQNSRITLKDDRFIFHGVNPLCEQNRLGCFFIVKSFRTIAIGVNFLSRNSVFRYLSKMRLKK